MNLRNNIFKKIKIKYLSKEDLKETIIINIPYDDFIRIQTKLFESNIIWNSGKKHIFVDIDEDGDDYSKICIYIHDDYTIEYCYNEYYDKCSGYENIKRLDYNEFKKLYKA